MQKTLDFSLLEKLQPSTVNISARPTLLQGPTVRIAPAPKQPHTSQAKPTSAMRPEYDSSQFMCTEVPTLPMLGTPTTMSTSDSIHCNQEQISSDHIQNTVLSQYLLNTPLETHKDDSSQFSSSDTVNELLKGFAAPSPKESTHILSLETQDVLPTFSQALKQCSIPEGITLISGIFIYNTATYYNVC